ncbi:unnamed protein product [Phytophthora fragariaefolia]|uniref:Unnamed protein product n=1 Tax=Phytophthora fragariaefolia TaxID=1490495 RepID=A0A9W6XUR6_9STRA|nr:unnamed protein product [Phytophthora fragariaefolia]
MADAEQLRVGGFKRILVRLDEATRRNQRVAVSGELVAALETLQNRLEVTTNTLVSQNVAPAALNVDENAIKKEGEVSPEAKALAKLALRSQELDEVATQIRRLEKLMPVELVRADDRSRKWWRRHVHKLGGHVLGLLTGHESEHRVLLRIGKALQKMETKWPELKSWRDANAAGSVKSKKRRAIPLPDDGETSDTGNRTVSAKSKEKNGTTSNTADKKDVQSPDKARALLLRCSREVRVLRDKFELDAFDVNLIRMVTVVDSLWLGVEHSEVVSLTTALFALVEMAEKVVNQSKRRDRLACLESVLSIVLESSELQLTARRKTMVEEYAKNCRQSLEQLNWQLEGEGGSVSGTGTESATPRMTTAPTSTRHIPIAQISNQKAWSESHIRFA